MRRCLSLDSYIKPQQRGRGARGLYVVYLLIPTSNHNVEGKQTWVGAVVYLLIPTSNHNSRQTHFRCLAVVYLLIPTSNHNKDAPMVFDTALFIS